LARSKRVSEPNEREKRIGISKSIKLASPTPPLLKNSLFYSTFLFYMLQLRAPHFHLIFRLVAHYLFGSVLLSFTNCKTFHFITLLFLFCKKIEQSCSYQRTVFDYKKEND